MSVTEYTDQYQHSKGKRHPDMEVPFPTGGPGGEIDRRCIHAHESAGMITNDFPDRRYRTVLAMYVKGDETGIYQAHTAEQCREWAQAFLDMADKVDEANAKENDNAQGN